MPAIAIDLYRVARAFTGRAAEFAAVACPTAAGWILTDSFILIVSHLASSSSLVELPVVWRSTLAHSAAGLEAMTGRLTAQPPDSSDCINRHPRPSYKA
jgi:hypothetical protein